MSGSEVARARMVPPATASDPRTACEICLRRLAPWCEKLGRQVWRCESCGHLAVPDGVVTEADGRSIYETDDSIFHRDGNADYYLDETNMQAAEAKVGFVRRYWSGSGPLLDVGASFGHFLRAIGGGCDAVGCELSPGAVEWSRRQLGVRNYVGSAYRIPDDLKGPFEAITCWDVIEHLEHPRRALDEMRSRLIAGSWLFLSTPDAGSATARMMGRHWHYLDPIQHVNLFSLGNLARLLKECGFDVQGHEHLGHAYRVSYVFNRLRFLAGAGVAGKAISAVGARLPEALRRRQVHIKLGDVVALAARRSG